MFIRGCVWFNFNLTLQLLSTNTRTHRALQLLFIQLFTSKFWDIIKTVIKYFDFVFISYFLLVIINVLSLCIVCMECMKHSCNTHTQIKIFLWEKKRHKGGILARKERVRRSDGVTDLAGHVPVWRRLSLISSQWAKSTLSLSLAQV